jgi:hypothetical protein
MDPGSICFYSSEPRIQLYFLLGLVYATVTPLLLPFILVFFALAYIVYRHQVKYNALLIFSLFINLTNLWMSSVVTAKTYDHHERTYDQAAAPALYPMHCCSFQLTKQVHVLFADVRLCIPCIGVGMNQPLLVSRLVHGFIWSMMLF